MTERVNFCLFKQYKTNLHVSFESWMDEGQLVISSYTKRNLDVKFYPQYVGIERTHGQIIV